VQEYDMPRYFFHIRDSNSTAQAQAIRLSGEILQERGAQLPTGAEWRLEVADEHGCILYVVHFSAEQNTTLADPQPNPPTPYRLCGEVPLQLDRCR
jgi:hypothetical protein